jgi:hypothetical protein
MEMLYPQILMRRDRLIMVYFENFDNDNGFNFFIDMFFYVRLLVI